MTYFLIHAHRERGAYRTYVVKDGRHYWFGWLISRLEAHRQARSLGCNVIVWWKRKDGRK